MTASSPCQECVAANERIHRMLRAAEAAMVNFPPSKTAAAAQAKARLAEVIAVGLNVPVWEVPIPADLKPRSAILRLLRSFR